MSGYLTHNIGETNSRRGLRCRYCGYMIKPTRRQRLAKTARQTCIDCGHSSWEICKNSLLHTENEIAENVIANVGRKIDSNKIIL